MLGGRGCCWEDSSLCAPLRAALQPPSYPDRAVENVVCLHLTLIWRCSAAPDPSPSASQRSGWLEIIHPAHLLVHEHRPQSQLLIQGIQGFLNTPLIIWVRAGWNQALRGFRHAEASRCTMSAGNFLNHFHSFLLPFNEHLKLYATGLGSHFVCFYPSP